MIISITPTISSINGIISPIGSIYSVSQYMPVTISIFAISIVAIGIVWIGRGIFRNFSRKNVKLI